MNQDQQLTLTDTHQFNTLFNYGVNHVKGFSRCSLEEAETCFLKGQDVICVFFFKNNDKLTGSSYVFSNKKFVWDDAKALILAIQDFQLYVESEEYVTKSKFYH